MVGTNVGHSGSQMGRNHADWHIHGIYLMILLELMVLPGYTIRGEGRYYDTPLFTLRGDEIADTDPSPRADFQFAMKKAQALIHCQKEIDRIIRKHYSP